MKKFIGIVIMAAMLVCLAGVTPYIADRESNGNVAYAAKKAEWTTVYSIWKGTKNSKIKAEGTNLYFFMKGDNLYFSNGKNGKAVKLGLARQLSYLSTDGSKIYFTDYKGNAYASSIYSYSVKTKKLKKVKTLNKYIWGVFSINNELGIYAKESAYDNENQLYKLNPKNDKIKSLFKEYYWQGEGDIKNDYNFLLTKVTEYDDELFEAKKMTLGLYNFKSEKMTKLLDCKIVESFDTKDEGNSYFGAMSDGENAHTSIYKFDWETGELEIVKEYDKAIYLEQNEGDGILYGVSSKLNGKKGERLRYNENYEEVMKEVELYDIEISTIDLSTFEKKAIGEHKDLDYSVGSTGLRSAQGCVEKHTHGEGEECKLKYFTYLYLGDEGYVFRDGKMYLHDKNNIEKFNKEFGGVIWLVY